MPSKTKLGLIVRAYIVRGVGQVFNSNSGKFVKQKVDTSVNMKLDTIKINTNHNQTIFNSYLAGLFEGDGHI